MKINTDRPLAQIPTHNPCPACECDMSIMQQIYDYARDSAEHHTLYMTTCLDENCPSGSTLSIGLRRHSDGLCFETERDEVKS